MTQEREVDLLKRRLGMSQKYWLRAAKKALAGDVRELRNRVDLFEAEPLEVILSGDTKEAPSDE